MSALQALDLRRRSASSVPPLPAGKPAAVEVAKLIDVSKCIGCKACQAACLEWNQLDQSIGYFDGSYNNPTDLTPASFTVMRYAEYENGDNLEWLIRKDGCMHCDDPGCLKACPSPGAIVQYTNGIVDFVSENCIGCGYCVKGCPFNIPRISKVDAKAYKCTLCSDRVVVGPAPAGAKASPTQAIGFGPKGQMIAQADKRIADLKSRGYQNAGLYNPPGVGGTHVMYVLHHNDKPSLYSGLPDNPRISPLVGLWKGAMKPISLAVIAFAGAFGLMHYIAKGPNRVTEHDEEEATKLERSKGA